MIPRKLDENSLQYILPKNQLIERLLKRTKSTIKNLENKEKVELEKTEKFDRKYYSHIGSRKQSARNSISAFSVKSKDSKSTNYDVYE